MTGRASVHRWRRGAVFDQMLNVRDTLKRSAQAGRRLMASVWRKSNVGYCPICEKRTVFVEEGAWLRDAYTCVRCGSIPRYRALLVVLNKEFPQWRHSVIHESSPSGSASAKLRAEATRYSCSQFFPHASLGSLVDGIRCENLENLTFKDDSIDIFVTQDVLEHVLRPEAALKEIARVVRHGGAHVFTVPVYWGRQTVLRAEPDHGDGVRLLLPAEYHGNPIDEKGSLVVREWGDDFPDFVHEHTGLDTTRFRLHDRRRGLDGEFIDVFVTRRST